MHTPLETFSQTHPLLKAYSITWVAMSSYQQCELRLMAMANPSVHVDLGWGLQSQFPPFRYFPNFSASPKCMLAIVYHVHIWQVLPQLSCGDTCQIRMWCKQSNRYFDRNETFAYGEINERSFSNPHPRPLQWRHNERHGVSNYRPLDGLLNSLFRHRSKNTSKIRVTGLCEGNSPVTGEFPHKGPVTRKMFPFDDVIMGQITKVFVYDLY